MNLMPVFHSILIAYLFATALYFARWITGKVILAKIGFRLTLFTALVQTITLALHWINQNQLVFVYLDYFQLSALVLAWLFLGLSVARKIFALGPLVLPTIVVLCLFSFVFENPTLMQPPVRGFGYLVFHLSAIFLSMSVFAIAFYTALGFLVSERALKLKRNSGWAARLPDLATLESIHTRAITLGFVIFTLALLTGAGYAKMTHGHYLSSDRKQILGLLVWAYFAILVNFRFSQGWRGHRGAILSLTGGFLLTVAYLVGFQ